MLVTQITGLQLRCGRLYAGLTLQRCSAPAALDRLAPTQSAAPLASRQRRRRDAEIVGGEVSLGALPRSRYGIQPISALRWLRELCHRSMSASGTKRTYRGVPANVRFRVQTGHR